ncbi:TPA: Ig-like domain-containing protein, partial [Photobacterium damselae]
DTSVKLIKSKSKTLSVTATYLSGKTEVITADKLTFTSSDDSVAKVDGSGKITALQAGDAVITTALASDNSVQVTTNVHVIKYSGVQISLSNRFIIYGKTAQIIAIDPATGITIPSSELTFTCNAPTEFGVSVSSSGLITAGNKPIQPLFTAVLKDNPSLKGTMTALIGPDGRAMGASYSDDSVSSNGLVFTTLNTSTGPFKVGDRVHLMYVDSGWLHYDLGSATSDNPDVATVTYNPLQQVYDITLKSAGVANVCTEVSSKPLCLKVTN